jgi:preprotein translocase subunit SecE
VARQTRADRRARREAREQQPQQPVRPRANGQEAIANGPERRAAIPHEEHPHVQRERGGIPGVRFVRESWGELQKVEWPNQNQLVQGTIVVLVACVIVGVYLWGAD